MYSIRIAIEGIENRRKSAGILHILIGSFLIAKGTEFYTSDRFLHYEKGWSVLPVLAVALLSIGYGLFRRRLDPPARYNYWLRLVQVVCFTAFGLAVMSRGNTLDYLGLFFFGLLSILLLFSERRLFQETIVYFTAEGIRLPGIYREHLLPWVMISEVVVRTDFLTIFHVRKKYLQYQVKQDLTVLEITKLNSYCSEQISAVSESARQA